MKPFIEHTSGPFAGLKAGDAVRVIYHEAPTELIQLTKINNYSIEGKAGEFACKVTLVGANNEMRLYITVAENRERVLRGVRLVKVS
jgi:hypothetical protein